MSICDPEYTTGIYLITNTVTGTVYVGSAAKRFKVRWTTHRWELRNHVHDNSYLQNAWDKYGESAFKFEIVEIVEDLSLIVAREQEWINRYYSLGRERCYNLAPTAGSQFGMKRSEETRRKISEANKRRPPRPKKPKILKGNQKSPEYRLKKSKVWPGFVSPDGTIYAPVVNLNAFAQEHDLRQSTLIGLAKGKHRHHKGWTRFGDEPLPTYAFVSPEGVHYESIRDLGGFCRSHNLSTGHMNSVHSGQRRHHKGWTRLSR